MKKILKFGWLLAFSVLLFTGCDALAGNDIDEHEILASGTTDNNSWRISRYLDEEDGVLNETISYEVIISAENLQGFSLTKAYSSGFSGWGGMILATTKTKEFYSEKLGYLIECDGTSIEFIKNETVKPTFKSKNEGDGVYSFRFNGQLYDEDVKKLAATPLSAIKIALKNTNGGSDEIPVNQEFLDAVKKYLLK